VYPYSFILGNSTALTIIAFGARWTCVDASGTVRTHDRVWSNLANFTGGNAVAPGATRLVTPVLSWDPNLTSSALAKAMAPFKNQRAVTASLEAVILRDGTAAGPDANNTIPRIQARLDAERQVLNGVVLALQQGGNEAAVVYLEGVVAAANPVPNGPLAAIQSTSASAAYTLSLSDMLPSFAKQFLQLSAKNPPAFDSYVQSTLATKTYPSVHR
jgi:hypothetical protein